MKVIGSLSVILQLFENCSIFEKVLQLFWSDLSNSEFKIVFILRNQFLSRETSSDLYQTVVVYHMFKFCERKKFTSDFFFKISASYKKGRIPKRVCFFGKPMQNRCATSNHLEKCLECKTIEYFNSLNRSDMMSQVWVCHRGEIPFSGHCSNDLQ